MYKNKLGLWVSVLGILSLVLITGGVTLAFFNYTKEGTTDNTITTGTITFIYTEVDKQGAGISIDDALPMSDDNGKIQSGTGEVFNFKIESKTMDSAAIPYTVTARMKSDSTLDQSAVKLYLTEVEGTTEKELLSSTYDVLKQTSIKIPEGTVEKVIYTDTVPKQSSNYVKNFRLRMWIPDTIKFSPTKDEAGNDVYPYNDKKFTVTVNVYAKAEVVSISDTTTYRAYNIGDAVTATDGSKWHVLEASDENTETVVLLSDYNLYADGTYNTECGRDINSQYVCSAMKFDTTAGTYKDYKETVNTNIGYFIVNTYAPLVTAALPGTTNVTIPTAEQIIIADGQDVDSFGSGFVTSNAWFATTNYWTKTPQSLESNNVSMKLVYGQYSGISSYDDAFSLTAGARPVITTLKSNLVVE